MCLPTQISPVLEDYVDVLEDVKEAPQGLQDLVYIASFVVRGSVDRPHYHTVHTDWPEAGGSN